MNSYQKLRADFEKAAPIWGKEKNGKSAKHHEFRTRNHESRTRLD